MHICHTFYDLPEYFFASAFRESCVRLLLDMMEYTHPMTKLHHEMNVCSLVYYFIQIHYIWMVKLRKRINFSMHSLWSALICKILLVISFQSDPMLCDFMLGPSYDGKWTLADLKSYLKITKLEWLQIWFALSTRKYHIWECFSSAHDCLFWKFWWNLLPINFYLLKSLWLFFHLIIGWCII